MAETERSNLPIAEEPEFTTEIPAIRPDDPVHFAQMNAMLEGLLGNDVFLKRLANKMIENSLIAHVLDSENPQMVLGADQGPAITGLIDEVKDDVTQLYSDMPKLSIKQKDLSDYLPLSFGNMDAASPSSCVHIVAKTTEDKKIFKSVISVNVLDVSQKEQYKHLFPFVSKVIEHENGNVMLSICAVKTYAVDYGYVTIEKLVVNYLAWE